MHNKVGESMDLMLWNGDDIVLGILCTPHSTIYLYGCQENICALGPKMFCKWVSFSATIILTAHASSSVERQRQRACAHQLAHLRHAVSRMTSSEIRRKFG